MEQLSEGLASAGPCGCFVLPSPEEGHWCCLRGLPSLVRLVPGLSQTPDFSHLHSPALSLQGFLTGKASPQPQGRRADKVVHSFKCKEMEGQQGHLAQACTILGHRRHWSSVQASPVLPSSAAPVPVPTWHRPLVPNPGVSALWH